MDSTTGHMLVEIVELQKEGRFHELSKEDFQLKTLDLSILAHGSMVNMWKSTNEKIEGKLEELRAEKEILKASNKELVEYIRSVLENTSLSQFDPNVEENKNLLLKLQQERQFMQVGRAWVDQIKAQGPPLVENLGSLVLDAHKLREAASNHQTTIQKAVDKLTEQSTLLQEVIDMKTNVAIAHRILKTGKESLFHWKQSLEFVIESSMRSAIELKDVHDMVQKFIEKLF